jgi:hypothetical protein
MTLIEEVIGFSRDYVNKESERTPERKNKIKAAYKELTGEIIRTTCSTCLIEYIFKIRSKMEKTTCRYQLKPGALLQAFGDPSKICTNKNITDELAEWHLKNNPGVISLFSKVPERPWEAPADTEIVKTKKTVTPPETIDLIKKAEEEAIKIASATANTGAVPLADKVPDKKEAKKETKTAAKKPASPKVKK